GNDVMKTSYQLQALWSGMLTFVLLLHGAPPAQAGGISPDLKHTVQANPNAAQPIRVIVQFARSGGDSDGVAKGHRGQVNSKHSLINGATMTVPQNAVAGLAQDPNVAWISPDCTVGARWDYDVEAIGADQVWTATGFRGSGVGVAVLDTGVQLSGSSSTDFKGWKTSSYRLVAWKDFVTGSPT